MNRGDVEALSQIVMKMWTERKRGKKEEREATEFCGFSLFAGFEARPYGVESTRTVREMDEQRMNAGSK
jgi:hypothetical protein